MNKYIIAIEGMSDLSEASLIAFFREHKVAWWHHVKNVWVIVDKEDVLSINDIREKCKEFRTADALVLVMKVASHGWSGSYPKKKKNPFEWFKTVWKRDDIEPSSPEEASD